MRLLEIDSHGELSLTADLVEDIPPYAILSHTWGADSDEVTFNDLKDGSGKSKAGYTKILFCGEQAQKDGLQYFWVDTCCIDKVNHAELAEAVVSMFRWCMNAAKCYVYLSDVSAHGSNNQNDQTWELSFRKSRWFTRCWTLQDLLAPRSVEFFSHEGQLLGNKQTLEWQIHEITNIPISALRGTPLSHFSVDERMKWAAKRKAKRIEDKAYSLMGIFGVFMPPIYGEGENAFIRLKREIQAAKEREGEGADDEKEEDDDDDEIVSAYSVDSLSSTVTGSSATLVGEVLAAANEFVSVLLEDEALAPLFSMAFDRIEADRLQRNIKRLLQLYASDLRQEAKGDIEKEAVHLILLRARYIAYRIRQQYDKSALLKVDENDNDSGRRALLEAYLGSRITQGPYSDHDDDKDRSDSDMSSEERADQHELSDLDRVKFFMFESSAYYKFRQNLRDFVLPRRELEQRDSMRVNLANFIPLGTWRKLQTKGLEIVLGLQILSRPLIPPGHKRITWICGCGDHRYADVQEYRPNGASRLQALLRRSGVATSTHGKGEGTSNPPRPPAQAHLPGNSADRVDNYNLPPPGKVDATVPAPLNDGVNPLALGLSSAQSDHTFLLLCLTIRGSSTLEQLSIGDLGNDQYLWEKIRGRYHELRNKTLWYQKSSLTRRLLTLRWFSWLVTTMDLTSPNSIQFVRFQLVPIAMDIRPWNFHSPSLPPETEVKVKKTYHYDPCPAEVNPTGLSRELLHTLWKPGPHLDRFWLNVFPKKLKEAMHYVSSKPEVNKGWGIRIVEGVNWASVASFGFILVSFSAILGIIYSALTHDVGAAFSISAFMGVLPALGVTLLQLRPIE